MLTVTETAKQLLKETLLAHSDDPEAGLRLSMKSPGQLWIMLDRGLPTDEVVEREGLKLLLVEPELVELLQVATVDVQDTDEGPKLVITEEKQNNRND